METKKIPMHEHKLAKIFYKMVAKKISPSNTVSKILCSRTNVADEDSMQTYVVDVVIHLTISRSCIRRHNWWRLHTRSHIRFADVSSMPSVHRDNGRREPPDTPTNSSTKCMNYELIFRQSFSKQCRWWSSNYGKKGGIKCVIRGRRGDSFIG
jgi:hypothetical protein